MNNLEYIEKTIDLFEASLTSTDAARYTTVRTLADKIGYTPHHLSRLFSSVCQISLGQYMLKRRLSEAFLRIRDTRETIGDITRALGWEDYSAFSRAFRKAFKTSAGKVRDNAVDMDTAALTFRARPRLIATESSFSNTPSLIDIPTLHVTGMVFFMDRSQKTFHKAWRLYGRYGHLIKGAAESAITYQFSSWPNENEEMREGLWILCAKETEPETVQDPIFFSKRFDATSALRFNHAGPVEALNQTYRYIWEAYLPSCPYKPKGNHEFQRYGADPNLIEIIIPVHIEAP